MAADAPALANDSANDWDIRLPDWVLHFAPVLIGLTCVTVALADYSVFEGYSEQESGTHLSFTLMAVVFVLSLAALRNARLSGPTRVVGGITSVLSGVAMLDEVNHYHEDIGRFVQKHVQVLPARLTFYTDDIIILLGAIIGGGILYYCLRLTGQRRALRPYFWAVVTLAVSHGVLDILGHRNYIVKMIYPDLSKRDANAIVDQLSTFEEMCKIWCCWFVVLFLERLFHGPRASLAWSLQVCLATGMACLGSWVLLDPQGGVPYLVIGEPLDFVRNFHVLLQLWWVWLGWAIIAWVCFRNDERRRVLSGLLLLSPFAVLAGHLDIADRLGTAISNLADWLLPNFYYDARMARRGLLLLIFVIPGAAVGLLGGLLSRALPKLLVVSQSAPLLAVGLLSPAAVFTNPWWLTAAVPVGVISVLQCRRDPPPLAARRPWLAAAAGYVLASVVMVWVGSFPRIPNYRFANRTREFFRLRHQDLPPDLQGSGLPVLTGQRSAARGSAAAPGDR